MKTAGQKEGAGRCPEMIPNRPGLDPHVYGTPCGKKLRVGKEYCAGHDPAKKKARVAAADLLHERDMTIARLRKVAADAAASLPHAGNCAWATGPADQPQDTCDCPIAELRKASGATP